MNLAFALYSGILGGFGIFFLVSYLAKGGRNSMSLTIALLLIFLGYGLNVIIRNNVASEVEQNYTDETAIYEEAVTDEYTVYINGMETDPENIDFDAFLRTGDITVTYNDEAKKILITRKD